MADIVIAGFGGQGVLTAGKILIDVAAALDNEVSWTSSYGAEMRGGTANCSIVVSKEEIGTPYPTKLDILMVMNEPSYDKFIDSVRPGGYVIVNSSLVTKEQYPDDLKVFKVDATSIANELGSGRAANLVMLGAAMKATNLVDPDLFAKGMNGFFDNKGKNSPKNMECYKAGMEKVCAC